MVMHWLRAFSSFYGSEWWHFFFVFSSMYGKDDHFVGNEKFIKIFLMVRTTIISLFLNEKMQKIGEKVW